MKGRDYLKPSGTFGRIPSLSSLLDTPKPPAEPAFDPLLFLYDDDFSIGQAGADVPFAAMEDYFPVERDDGESVSLSTGVGDMQCIGAEHDSRLREKGGQEQVHEKRAQSNKSNKSNKRDASYFREAAKKSRQKKKAEEDRLRENVEVMEVEQSQFRAKITELKAELQLLSQDKLNTGSKKQRLECFRENQLLKQEVQLYRMFSKNIRLMTDSLQTDSTKLRGLTVVSTSAKNALYDLSALCYSSMTSNNWKPVDLPGLALEGALSGCKTQFKTFLGEFFYIRQDLTNLPMSYTAAVELFSLLNEPEIYEEMFRAMDYQGNLKVKEGYSNKMEAVDINLDSPGVFESATGKNEPKLVKWKESFEDEESELLVVVEKIDQRMNPQSFPQDFVDESSQNHKGAEATIFSLTSLPKSAHSMFPSYTGKSMYDYDVDVFLEGTIFTRGENNTTNITLMTRFPSYESVAEHINKVHTIGAGDCNEIQLLESFTTMKMMYVDLTIRKGPTFMKKYESMSRKS